MSERYGLTSNLSDEIDSPQKMRGTAAFNFTENGFLNINSLKSCFASPQHYKNSQKRGRSPKSSKIN